jgi:hypothetical protein
MEEETGEKAYKIRLCIIAKKAASLYIMDMIKPSVLVYMKRYVAVSCDFLYNNRKKGGKL